MTKQHQYELMHDPVKAIEHVFGMSEDRFPKQSWERMKIAWVTEFMMDDSGRSTAKTFNCMMIGIAKNTILPDRVMNLFGMDLRRGIKLTDKHVGFWLRNCKRFQDGVQRQHKSIEPKISHNTQGATLPWINGSLYQTYTPGLSSGAQAVQSDRSNHLIFNEWTSWDAIDEIEEMIEPINSNTNYPYAFTVRLRIATEKSLGVPLGRLTNEYLILTNTGKSGYIPRRWLLEVKPDNTFQKQLNRFKSNFFHTFGFEYDYGVKYLGFKEIKSKKGIIDYFSDYLDGDPVYNNQIIYDGSAKRPSDDCYEFREYFTNKIASGDPHYNDYNMSVDDLSEEWDGIVFKSSVVNKARERMLDEDFQRVYGGKWVEGQSLKPFDIVEIRRCHDDARSVQLIRRDPQAEIICAIDSAKGTEKLRKTRESKNVSGKGDDACACVLRVGDGTASRPHEILHIYKAEDVRKEPMAIDLHHLHDAFRFNLMGIDPNGGGTDLVDALSNKKIHWNDKDHSFKPIVPVDYLDLGSEDNIIRFISRSDKLITEVYKKSHSLPAFWGEDVLKGTIIDTAKTAIANNGVTFPREIGHRKLVMMRNTNEISALEMQSVLNIEEAIKQLTRIRHALNRDKSKKKTKNGIFMYEYPKKKDSATVIMYAIFLAEVLVRYKELVQQNNAGGSAYPMAVG